MVKVREKLILSLSILVASLFLLRLGGWFGLGVLVGLINSIVYWFDTAAEIQAAPPSSLMLHIFGLLMGIPVLVRIARSRYGRT